MTTSTTSGHADEALLNLLQETITRYMVSEARILRVLSSPLTNGRSGAIVQRHQILLQTEQGRLETSLVTKTAGLLERRTLALLSQQGQVCVPFNHTFDLTTDEAALLCLQDLGEKEWPDTGPLDPAHLKSLAHRLVLLHQENLGQTTTWSWLPRADGNFITHFIHQRFWRPAWEQVVHDKTFVQLFGSVIPQVEAAAERIVDEMEALYREEQALTLLHADLNPFNVLIWKNQPYLIDWQIPRYGSFYLDIPHMFYTRELAEFYYQALLNVGCNVSSKDFTERYLIASRFIGLSYLAGPLRKWHKDQTKNYWISHYLSLILQ